MFTVAELFKNIFFSYLLKIHIYTKQVLQNLCGTKLSLGDISVANLIIFMKWLK